MHNNPSFPHPIFLTRCRQRNQKAQRCREVWKTAMLLGKLGLYHQKMVKPSFCVCSWKVFCFWFHQLTIWQEWKLISRVIREFLAEINSGALSIWHKSKVKYLTKNLRVETLTLYCISIRKNVSALTEWMIWFVHPPNRPIWKQHHWKEHEKLFRTGLDSMSQLSLSIV